jgi:outer membrane autotransporter protein
LYQRESSVTHFYEPLPGFLHPAISGGERPSPIGINNYNKEMIHMSSNFKKLLLAGTALVAVSAASTSAQAVVFTNTPTQITSGASGIWANTTNGVQAQATHATIATAGAGDHVDIAAGQTLTVTNNGTAMDGTDVPGNAFVLGTITNTAGTGAITLTDVDTKSLTVTIGSVNIGGAFTSTSPTGTAGNKVLATITGNMTAGSLVLTNNNVTGASSSAVTTVGGALVVNTTTGITSANAAGNEQSLIVTGNSQFTGAVTLTSVTNTANNAILNLKGATNVATAGIVLTEAAADTGRSAINFTGTAAQTLTGGAITATNASSGIIQIKNSAGVTVNNTVGVGGGGALRGITISHGVGNSSATFKNTVTAPITLGAAAGTVAGVTYGAATAGDVNTVTFDSTTQAFTVTGAIAGQNAVQTNNVVVQGGKTVTLATASTSNLNNITATGAATVLAAGANLTAGNLIASNGGTIKTTAGVTLTGAINNTGGTIDIGAATTLANAFTNTGTLFVENNLTATLTLGMVDTSAGTIKIGMNGAQFGVVAEGAGAADLSKSTVAIVGTAITPGTRVVFTGAAAGAKVPLSITGAFINATAAVNGNNVEVTTTAKTLTGNQVLATSIINTAAMQAALPAGTLVNIQNSGTPAELDTALDAIRPTVDGSSSQTAFDAGAAVQGVANTRMASLRSGDGMTGMAAGSSSNGVSMWLQGYGQTAEQKTRSGVAGYDSDTLGVAVGVDSTNMLNDGVLGLVFNYGRSTADSSNANTTSTDVDNYGIGIYGSHDVGNQVFVNGQVGYAFNNINSVRHNVGAPGNGLVANADYDSSLWSAKLAVGRDYAMDHGLTLTPSAFASYMNLENDAYNETGTAGGGLLNVNSNSVDNFDIGVGLNAGWKFKNADGSAMKPSLHANYTYTATDNALQTTAVFQGAVNNAFTTAGPNPSRSAFNVGGGVVYATTANWDLSANYDYTWKEQYGAHNGSLRATTHF